MNKILMYHSISNNRIDEASARLYCVPVDKFREQMELVKQQGQSPSGTVPVVTFDDGLEDNFTNAYPILKETGLKAYFFILVYNVGKPGYMSWGQIKELSNAGMIIGSHGMTHKILVGLNQSDIDYEISKSKKILEEKLGIIIGYFSVPKGHYNNNVIGNLKKTGYKTVFTSDYRDNDGFIIGRIAVKGNWNMQHFSKVITSGLTLSDKIERAVKNTGKNLFGAGVYDRLRTGLLRSDNNK